jgi:catechol 2,3-dioxygenase-like lactoylglutathione lyase family enzyme
MKLSLTILAANLLCLPLAAQDQPARPPITGIAHVRIFSTDLHKSLDSYSQVLGTAARNAGCTGMARPCFIVNDRQQILISELSSAPPENLLAEIAFATPDLARMRAYLLAHNLAAGPVTRDISAVSHFSLRDPEGNTIVFVQLHPRGLFTAPAEQVTTHMIHAGFVVHDRATTDHFYKEILGFRPYWHGGMKDDKDDWVAMQVPDGTDWVEYMLNISPTADKHTLGVMNHIALGVPDIQAAKAQLIKNGWKPGEEPKLGRDGKWQLNLYDPDDTRIEFMEFTPKEKPCCSEFTGPHPGPKQ